ncbi:MAG: hypothetical protein WBP81_01555 [Solirubrobacteraceae bacterium]
MTDAHSDPRRLAGRLLRPAESELTCKECFDQLYVYVELELASRAADHQVPGMRAHLENCPACAEEYDSLRALIVGAL